MVWYQIYPLGAAGAPFENDGKPASRLHRFHDWIPHLQKLGIQGVLFNPLFQSRTHGYDTTDYLQVDSRLGTEEDLADLCSDLKEAGISILFDAVFNHVGRDFAPFQDVLQNREASPYKDWFFLNFDGNNSYDDHLWYQNWEGYDALVKLNVTNPAVQDYLFSVVQHWIDTYGIAGLRLDVAYCLDKEFLKRLRTAFPDLYLMGEMLHGDYNQWVNPDMLDTGTNYECYKGIHSSFNSHNFFEVLYAFNRQSGKEPWCLYTGKNLWNFVDNHDVPRIASILQDPAWLPLVYTMLFTMPGVPCLYYGSEWGIQGEKNANDTALRPEVEMPEWNELTDHIQKLIAIHNASPALQNGDYEQIALTNEACLYARSREGQTIYCAINMKAEPVTLHFNRNFAATDLLTGKTIVAEGCLEIPAVTSMVLEETK